MAEERNQIFNRMHEIDMEMDIDEIRVRQPIWEQLNNGMEVDEYPFYSEFSFQYSWNGRLVTITYKKNNRIWFDARDE